MCVKYLSALHKNASHAGHAGHVPQTTNCKVQFPDRQTVSIDDLTKHCYFYSEISIFLFNYFYDIEYSLMDKHTSQQKVQIVYQVIIRQPVLVSM